MKQPTYFMTLFFATSAFASLFFAGCQSQQYADPEEGVLKTDQGVLTAGDSLEIKFFYTPELSTTQVIRPDGRISMQLVGDVEAAGKTPFELKYKLLALYQPLLVDPDITVVVQSFYKRRIYVGGEVETPGMVEMPGNITALEAVMQAGGFLLPRAQPRSVVVIRHKDDKRYGYAIDLQKALDGEEIIPFYLQPQDIIFVPRTAVAKVGDWVDQNINRIVPQTGFSLTSSRGRTTIGYDIR